MLNHPPYLLYCVLRVVVWWGLQGISSFSFDNNSILEPVVTEKEKNVFLTAGRSETHP